MKKLLLIAFVIFCATAQRVHGQNKFQDGEYDVFVLINGKVLRVHDKDQIKMLESIMLDDGTELKADGSFHVNDGQKLQLPNGECLDNNGVKYRNEYLYRLNVEHENKRTIVSKSIENTKKRFLLMLIKGEVYQNIYHQQYNIQNSFNLGHGRLLQPNGIHRTSYGYSQLKEGGCLSIHGKPLINLYEHRKAIARKIKRSKKRLAKKTI